MSTHLNTNKNGIDAELISLLSLIRELFTKRNIKFWLDQGTLLGAVRDRKPIDGDNDIDISIKSNDFDDTLKIMAQLKDKGYHVKYQKDLPFIDDLIQVYLSNDTKMLSKNHIDINIYSHINNSYIRHGIHETTSDMAKKILHILRVITSNRFEPKNYILKIIMKTPRIFRINISCFIMKLYFKIFKSISQIIPEAFFSDFKNINFLNMDFFIPKKVEGYLEYRFGSDWKIPNDGSRGAWVWPNSDDKAVKFQRLKYLHPKSISVIKGVIIGK